MMSRIQWKSRRVTGLIASVILFYILMKAQTYTHTAFVFLPKTYPNDAWEFVADFSNMKLLNPTIIDFNIIEESGNYDHWTYSTEYTENLSHWPHMQNTAIAHFSVKTSPTKDTYHIYSVHRTCFLNGLYCLDSKSEFRFSGTGNSNGALCEEIVEYECPRIFFAFCKREVVFQRTAIMNNLKNYFERKLKP